MPTRTPLALLAAALLIACPTDHEGDEPGECADGADNDRDGAWDCDDPDCAGAPECAAAADATDDDDSAPDDDDTTDDDDSAPDDDDVTDDDDGAPDDDDSAGAELVQSEGAWIAITAPNYGLALGVDVELVTFEGTAADDVVSVSWATDGGATGTADGVQAWSAMDVPMQAGDNVFTATATDGVGETRSVAVLVVYNPDVPFGSGLALSPARVFVGEATEVTATVWLNSDAGLDALEVGPTDEAGALLESWATMEPVADGPEGLYAGTWIVDEPATTSWEVRAVATYSSAAGSTPPVTASVIEAITEADCAEAIAIGEVVWEAFEAAGGPGGGIASRDAAVAAALAQPGVAEVGTSDDDGAGAWWVTDAGIPYVLMNNPPGTKGGPMTSDPEPEVATGGGAGSLRAWTTSSAGRAGRGGRALRDVDPVVGSPTLFLYQAYDDEFENDATLDAIEEAAEESTCPTFYTPSAVQWHWNTNADLDRFDQSLGFGLQHIDTHGDTYFSGSDTKLASWHYNGGGGLVGLYTRDAVPGPTEMAEHVLDVANGHLAVGAGSPQYWTILPGYVEHKTQTEKMDDPLVVLSACRSLKNVSMALAYVVGGADTVVGYTEYVNIDYAADRDWKFWSSIFGLKDAAGAWAVMEQPLTVDTIVNPSFQTTGARPSVEGFKTASIANGDIRNPSFEDGTDSMGFPEGWLETTAGNQSDWAVGGDSNSYPGIVPTDGSNMVWAVTDMDGNPAASYAELQHAACFNPGSSYTIQFDWTVVTNAINGCGSPVYYSVFFRFHDGSAVTSLWSADWSTICPLLSDTSTYWRATPWSTETLTFSTAVEPSQLTQIRISASGPEWETYYLIVDHVRVYPTPTW